MNKLIRRAIASWLNWKRFRIDGEYAHFVKEIAKAKRSHKSTKNIYRDLCRMTTESLKQ